MRVLGINSVFHDPAAALVIDGTVVAAAEEERFSRRKHGKRPVPFSAWEQPAAAARWCLEQGGIGAGQVDLIGFSYDPGLVRPAGEMGLDDPWDDLRTRYTALAPQFLADALPGLDPRRARFVRHHVAHAASAGLAVPAAQCSVLVCDGRGERESCLTGRYSGRQLRVLSTQPLPHSLGLMYEELTDHLGFLRSSDEYKVMAMSSYAEPTMLPLFRELIRPTDDGGFVVEPIPWSELTPRRLPDGDFSADHFALACSVQRRLEEVILDLARWLHARTGQRAITMAGGVALNCVANARLHAEGPFEEVWVQPAAGDAGTALGGALYESRRLGDRLTPFTTAALGRAWTDAEIEAALREADVAYERPDDLPATVADILAANGVVAWFQGASEYGPRALGHRSLLADPRRADNLERLNRIKGREQFRPVAPMVTVEAAGDIFEGKLPSPYMLFTHRVRPRWRHEIPAAIHVDGSARVQTVARADEPLVHAL